MHSIRLSAKLAISGLVGIVLAGCGAGAPCPSAEQGLTDGKNAGKAWADALIATYGQEAFSGGQIPEGALNDVPVETLGAYYSSSASSGCPDYDKQFMTGLAEGLVTQLLGIKIEDLTDEQRQQFEQLVEQLYSQPGS